MGTDSRPEIILGAGLLGSNRYPDVASVKGYCDLFHFFGHTRIDHARIYPPGAPGRAEELMEPAGATQWAIFDTKATAMGNREHSRENIAKSIQLSLDALKCSQLDVFYLHLAADDVSFEDTMDAVDQAYKDGKFRRLGLSDQSPSQVDELVSIAERNGYVKPTVYQGHYNAVCRKAEKSLLPVLRKHGLSYFAFAPSAVGLFSGQVTKDSIHDDDSRFSNKTPVGKFWSDAYLRPEILDAAEKVRFEAGFEAEKLGISGHAVALRWVLHHSALQSSLGDGIIIGARNLEQLRDHLEACDAGPLPSALAKVVEDIWLDVEPVAPWAWMGDVSGEIRKEFDQNDESHYIKS